MANTCHIFIVLSDVQRYLILQKMMLMFALVITAIGAFHVTRMMATVSKTLSSLEEGKPKKRVSFGSEGVKYFDAYDTPKSIKKMVEIVGRIGQVENPSRWMRVLDWIVGILDSSPDVMNRIGDFDIHDSF